MLLEINTLNYVRLSPQILESDPLSMSRARFDYGHLQAQLYDPRRPMPS